MTTKTKQQAIAEVDHQMISPTDCFVTYAGTKEGWKPLHGTGCAHYVAHKLNIKSGQIGITACDLGFTLRVPMLIANMHRIVDINKVAVNDVWVNHARDHCGIVIAFQAAEPGKRYPKITISQCSSNRRRAESASINRIGPNSSTRTEISTANASI